MKNQIKETIENLLKTIRLGKNRRQHVRIVPESYLDAKIHQSDRMARVADISSHGASISMREANFSIGDLVEISFYSSTGQIVECQGRILSQCVYHPYGIDDLKRAIFRFSIQFENPIDVSSLLKEEKSAPSRAGHEQSPEMKMVG